MRRLYSYVLGHEETSRCKDGTSEKIKLCSLVFSSFRGFTNTLLKIHLTYKSSIGAYNNVCFTIACKQKPEDLV